MLMAPLTSADPPIGADSAIDEILRAVRTHLSMDVGFISEFVDGHRVFRHVENAPGKRCIEVGGSDPLEESYCHWVAKGKLPRLIQDPADHPFTARFPATKGLPVGAHLSIPIHLRDGRLYGTFCCFSFIPDRTLNDRDLAMMEAFAQVAGAQIEQRLDIDYERQAKIARIQAVLDSDKLDIAHQPAIRLDSPEIAFVEALARFESDPYQSPDRWFAMAAEVGLGLELELLAVTCALASLDDLPDDATLSINVSPDTAISPGLHDLLDAAPLERLILEITEHQKVECYGTLLGALAPLRERGLRVAIDDTGAGYSSFRHILQMKPDMIKLDMSISRGINRDPARRALASALIAFANDIGSELVAEGVETAAEMRSLRDLGFTIVQGHLVARPAPSKVFNQPHWPLASVDQHAGN